MVRLVLLLVLLAVVAWAVWALLRRARSARGPEGDYTVIESVGDGHAHVQIGRPLSGEAVLIGSVALDAADFDERYGEILVRAEDRVATLNAGRRLVSGSGSAS